MGKISSGGQVALEGCPLPLCGRKPVLEALYVKQVYAAKFCLKLKLLKKLTDWMNRPNLTRLDAWVIVINFPFNYRTTSTFRLSTFCSCQVI